ncbi:YebO family protein [Erwinia sp.]|uniref:YebO family protein n=1 Tax=Erwinia citreus TaxID=558 RepID=UPI00289AF856|nr:YebO family protein [Erwinia sp.]
MLNEVANGTAGAALLLGLTLIGLVAWFFINRASVRANEQIRLLEALLDEQKHQNQLLLKLVGAQQSPAQPDEESDFIRLIPER